ncbi:hypothetical protein M422DRAFT_58967 [Sphaerobolus stellatus SS14]|nr:hypothetical protein M422DRAFT_58967 [Sphaerobolus stellatus SS14]
MSNLYPVKKKAPELYTTEFDILKSRHRFLREDDPENAKSWEDQLAKKYEATLFKEFAVCDLKHYKSGNIALRWRTEEEVISGAGETTCGNTRCPYHASFAEEDDNGRDRESRPPHLPKLTTVELPFSYIEDGTPREALVKVVLCERCFKKLMYKREKDKKERLAAAASVELGAEAATPSKDSERHDKDRREKGGEREARRSRHERGGKSRSRSRSPRRQR